MLTKVLPVLKYLHLDSVTETDSGVVITGATKRTIAHCPVCGHQTRSVHSRYQRRVADLPVAGIAVTLQITVRKFFCRTRSCPRRIFTERLPAFVAPHARRSHALREGLRQIAFTVGGEAGARLAQPLGMPTSPDTLLRLIRSTHIPTPADPCIIGVDEWAWRKGVRYGTIVVDLERHQVAALLPERDADQVAAWLNAHPTITVVSRDRAGLYADAATRGAPQATQVADRFHLMRNLGDALEAFLLRKRSHLKQTAAAVAELLGPPAASAAPIDEMYQGKRKNPASQLCVQRAEETSWNRHARSVAAYEAVHDLHTKGTTIADIARTVGISRPTVYRYLRLDAPPARKQPVRSHNPERGAWEAYVTRRWMEGCHNGRQLWREARTACLRCGERNVARFVAELRRAGPRPPVRAPRAGVTSVQGPTARHVAMLFLRRPSSLTREQATYLQQLCAGDSVVSTAYDLTHTFGQMVRERQGERLDAWIERAVQSDVAEIRRFASGLHGDHAAVQAGLRSVYSNGQTEGQIHRLKLIRRSMYGRGKFDLVSQRVLWTTEHQRRRSNNDGRGRAGVPDGYCTASPVT